MQMRVLTRSSSVHTVAPEKAAIEKPDFVHDGRRPSPTAKPNMALAGVLLGFPAMVIAFIALLIAGRPFVEALLLAYGLQFLVFFIVIVVGLARAKYSERGVSIDTVYADFDQSNFELRTFGNSTP